MLNEIRTYFRRVAEGYEDGALARFLCPLLEIGANVYNFMAQTNRSLYAKGILKSKKLPFPVVSIGNLTWGGTGKTPFVEYLVKKASDRHRTPLILTRGYNHDEVDQFRAHLPKAVIGVGSNRFSVAKKLAKKHRINFAVLDDGLQHWPVQRDIDVVMVNALNPFGNRKLIPRGILREPVSVLKRAHIVVLSHTNLVSPKELSKLKGELRRVAPEVFIVESYLEPLFFYRARKRGRLSLDRLKNQRVTTFSAVGAPRSFQLLLQNQEIRPIRNFEFTDHYTYSKRDLEEIQNISDSSVSTEIVTTEKDYYRCPDLIAETLNPLILATRLRISSGEEVLTERLFRLLGVKTR